MKNKRGISLIVLVITIIVMIILAASVVITLNNTGIINRANQAVSKTNLKEVEQLAYLTWAEEYMEGKRGMVLKTAVISALDKYKNEYDIEVTDKGVVVTNKNMENEDGEWINDASTSSIKFRQPYVMYKEMGNGEIFEYVMVFYEEGVATLFLNGAHGQTEAYPAFEVEYCKNKLRLYMIGIPKDEGYEEYTISSNGKSISTQVYVSSTEGDYYETVQANLTTLEELNYDIIIDIDTSVRTLNGDFCIFSSSSGSEETELGETYRIIEYRLGYIPNVYPEYMDEITSYFPGLKELEFIGIVKVYFNKEKLTLMERDDYGDWDEENYILTLTNEEVKNRTTEIYYKFKSKTNGTSGMYANTSVGCIMYEE